eukprot:9883421-Lingulodinium_polyedra.AAC.1
MGKRWLTPEGHEWQIPAAAGTYNAAYHSLKLLAGGVAGAARKRNRAAGRFAHCCRACACEEIEAVWRSGELPTRRSL